MGKINDDDDDDDDDDESVADNRWRSRPHGADRNIINDRQVCNDGSIRSGCSIRTRNIPNQRQV